MRTQGKVLVAVLAVCSAVSCGAERARSRAGAALDATDTMSLNFTANPGWTGAAPFFVELDATTSKVLQAGNWIASYRITTSDGASTTNGWLDHTFQAPGTYTATVTATDANGHAQSKTATITVTGTTTGTTSGGSTGTGGHQPVALITGGPFTLAAPGGVWIDGTTSFVRVAGGWIRAYHWDFGDGSTLDAGYGVHNYAANGTYTVTLTVTDDLGATASVTQRIQIGTSGGTTTGGTTTGGTTTGGTTGSTGHQPIAVITGGPFTLASPGGVWMDGTTSAVRVAGGWIRAYHWSFGDGSSADVGYIVHNYAANGAYTVTLTVTDDLGATASATQVVRIGATGTTTGTTTTGSTTGGTTTGTTGTTGGTGGTIHAVAQAAPAGGWSLYGAASAAPVTVNDAAFDRGGNLWVAGGEQGLFVLRPGASTFQRFGLGDGLHPYGAGATQIYLNAISVAGGEAGNAYVGYAGIGDCEDEWDQNASNPNMNIVKSGDADHVWLSGGGIAVAHYDISSPPGFVADELRGREKLCTIYRLAYDRDRGNLWVGANHGYAWLNPGYTGSGTAVMEHAHPAVNGYLTETAPAIDDYLLTGGYYGLTVEPGGALWVGGIYRTYRCAAGAGGAGFWTCESTDANPANHTDIWPDPVAHDARPSQRVDDYVTGLAVMPDGSVWASARNRQDNPNQPQAMGVGLAHLSSGGAVLGYLTDAMLSTHLTALAADPDGTLWIGSEAGLMRYDPSRGVVSQFTSAALGGSASDYVTNIQVDRASSPRRVVVAFRSGVVGVYAGP